MVVRKKYGIEEASLKKIRNVALIIPALDAKGPTIFTKYLIRELKKLVENIEVFYFKGTKQIELGVKCTKLNFWKHNSFDSFDIVHTTMAVPDLYASLNVEKNKWISSMHNYFEIDLKMLYGKVKATAIIMLWKWALKSCNNIIVSSRAMEQYYKKNIGKKNYTIIPYGVEIPTYSEISENDKLIIEKWKEQGFTIIGTVGVFIKRKGFEQLISILNRDNKSALFIIGDGADREHVKNLCDEQHLSSRVYFPGYRDNAYNYYKYFDLYAHVSYSEGFGIAMLEAMSKGLPIICSRLDIYEDYFTDNDVCFFDVGNEESLIKAYQKLLSEKEYYSQASYRLYMEKFNLKSMAQAHLKFYESVGN